MQIKLKYGLDYVFAVILGIILFLPMTLIALILMVYYKGSPFYTPERSGLHGKKFRQFKFKTMHDYTDENNVILPDDERVSKLGLFLRKTSLDELPQLYNVIRGEISIIGPRPLTDEYMPFYTGEEKLRFRMKPGITGWAQVNGRNSIDWKKKFELDVQYVSNYSLLKDLKILFITIKVLLRSEGISQNGYVSSERYRG